MMLFIAVLVPKRVMGRYSSWAMTGCFNHRCSALMMIPGVQLFLFAGWGFLVPAAFLCVLGGGVSCVAYRAQLGRLGGSRWGWVLQIKIPVPPHTLSFSEEKMETLHLSVDGCAHCIKGRRTARARTLLKGRRMFIHMKRRPFPQRPKDRVCDFTALLLICEDRKDHV